MSQGHIPQPSTQSAAPAEVFDSTADAPHGASVSALGTAGPRAPEVSSHSGQKNTFDISIHRQFIPTDTFLWSTTATRGTLLWSNPIHPTRANPLIAYLSGMYNTWGGSLEFNFKVAGTGFHAGALAFVRIPPNKRPSDYTSPTSWGAFEYVVMDPKTLEVMSVDVIDQRPVMFHYMGFDERDPMSFGGYIACYVLIPLNTSSTGSQTIAVQAFDRPGQTFTLNQLVIPNQEVIDHPQPVVLANALNAKISSGCNTRIQLAGVRAQPTNSSQILTYGHYDAYGARPAKWEKEDMDIGFSLRNPWVVRAYSSVSKVYTLTPGQYTSILFSSDPGTLGCERPTGVGGSKYAFQSRQSTFVPQTDGTYKLNFTLTITEPDTAASEALYVTPVSTAYNSQIGLPTGKLPKGFTWAIPNSEETLLVYGFTSVSVYDFQLLSVQDLAQKGQLKSLFPSGSALLFNVVDDKTDLPLAAVKMYSNLYMTVHKSYAGTFWPDVHFEFDSYIVETQPIPFNPTFYMNSKILGFSAGEPSPK